MLSSRQMAEWEAYFSIEPWGTAYDDARFAFMTAHLLSPHMKAGTQPQVRDFMMNPPPLSEQQKLAERIKQMMRANFESVEAQ